ncbi:HD domain-containing protein [bacterium]|nr:HD domain-containing protein [bacterium]
MSSLERAIELAVQHHKGQVDKMGQPYILHPLRVMHRCQGVQAQIVAIMHDLLEDTPLTPEALLNEGFSQEIVDALEGVSRRKNESYREFVLRARQNPLSRQVKLADLEDNLDLRRLTVPLNPKDHQRLERYREAWHLLQS